MHVTPNKKKYIGITHYDCKQRWRKDGLGYKTQTLFWRAIQKYGWDNIEHIIIAENLSKEDACRLEQKLIAQYNTMNKDFGYNLTGGGEGHFNVKMSEETKEKLRQANRGKHHTEETKRKISENHSRHNLGLVMPEETKKKISEAHKGKIPWNKGKKLSDEYRKKLSEAHKGKSPGNKGKHCSEETKKLISEANKGRVAWNKGKHLSDEQKEKLRQANLGKKLSDETRRKMSESHRKQKLS